MSSSTGWTIPAGLGSVEWSGPSRNPGTSCRPGDDYLRMDCDRCRAAISAALDGEDPGFAPDAGAGPRRRAARAVASSPPGARQLHRADPGHPGGAGAGPHRLDPALDRRRTRRRAHVDERTRFLRISLAVVAVIQLDDGGPRARPRRRRRPADPRRPPPRVRSRWRSASGSWSSPGNRSARPGCCRWSPRVVLCLRRELAHRHHLGRGRARRRGEPRARAGRAGRGLAARPHARRRAATEPDPVLG